MNQVYLIFQRFIISEDIEMNVLVCANVDPNISRSQIEAQIRVNSENVKKQ